MKDENSNRAMLLTPPGAAAIAVVRLRGSRVESFLQQHFCKPVLPEKCIHGNLKAGDRIIDDPVIVLSKDKNTVDINLHGGEWIVRECLTLAENHGFAIVENSHDLLDAETILEREMLTALPLARTEQAIRILLAQPKLWAMIDLNKLEIERMLGDRSLWWMLHPPRVAIVGIANVGKSTLANQLFGRDRSITADAPGTTRDWVGDFANLDGLPIQLLDTPGQRVSSDKIEQTAIARSEEQITSVDLILLVLDPTQPQEDQNLIRERYPHAMLVMNKSDVSQGWKVPTSIRTIATVGAGIDELRQKIRSQFVSTESGPLWWTARQREIIARALIDPGALREI